MTGKGKADQTFDAIVVGSGISGGWAAKELCEAGLRTLVLERGRNVEHVKDYPTANLDPWELPFGNKPSVQDLEDYPVQKDLYLFGQDSKHFLVKDKDHPYNPVKDFRWFRGYQVGGRSLLWARHCFRWSDLDFEANAKEGVGIDWPIRYKDLEPWYDRVESFIGVSGENAGLPQLPDGKLLPRLRDELRRKAHQAADAGALRRSPADREPGGGAEPAPQRSRQVHVAQPLPARLPARRLLLEQLVDPARGRRHRAPDLEALLHRPEPHLRRGHGPGRRACG